MSGKRWLLFSYKLLAIIHTTGKVLWWIIQDNVSYQAWVSIVKRVAHITYFSTQRTRLDNDQNPLNRVYERLLKYNNLSRVNVILILMIIMLDNDKLQVMRM